MRLEGDVENRGYLDFIRKIKGVVGFGGGGDISKAKPLGKGWGYSDGQRDQWEAEPGSSW